MRCFNPNPLGCVQNLIQIGGFGTVTVNIQGSARAVLFLRFSRR